jgi:hypothetical protein
MTSLPVPREREEAGFGMAAKGERGTYRSLVKGEGARGGAGRAAGRPPRRPGSKWHPNPQSGQRQARPRPTEAGARVNRVTRKPK